MASASRVPTRLGEPLVTVIIITILGLQVFAGFRDPAQWGWPFVAYPMYRGAHYEGERLRHDFTVYARLADGTKARVTPEDLGMHFWLFRANVVDSLYRQRLDLLQPVADLICGRTGQPVLGLELEDLGMAVSREGLVEGLPPEVVTTANLSCSN
jgi:hypothetical protein